LSLFFFTFLFLNPNTVATRSTTKQPTTMPAIAPDDTVTVGAPLLSCALAAEDGIGVESDAKADVVNDDNVDDGSVAVVEEVIVVSVVVGDTDVTGFKPVSVVWCGS
jgi:hypothetical protein